MSHKRSIYLAGKIAKNDWRHRVANLRSPGNVQFADLLYGEPRTTTWDRHNVDVLGTWKYAGPYFTSDDHGCAHYGSDHATVGKGCIPSSDKWKDPGSHADLARPWVHAQCLAAIGRCDIFFAWVNDPTAHGTLVEIGYAKALGKRIVVAAPGEPDWAEFDPSVDDMWFALHTADRHFYVDDPTEALKALAEEERLSQLLESPIEQAFWYAYIKDRHEYPRLARLKPQHVVGRYRLDFALVDDKIAIELDGYSHHSSRQQFTRDRQRQRDLELEGWRFVRFSGSEVKNDPSRCVFDASRAVNNILFERSGAA